MKIKHIYQRITRGFDDSETWSLDYTIAKFALPRLRRFKEIVGDRFLPSGVANIEEWRYILGEIEWAFEQYETEAIWSMSKEDDERFKNAMELFGKHFRALWW